MTVEETIKQHINEICVNTGAARPITIPAVFKLFREHLGEPKAIELFEAAVVETKGNPFRWTSYQATLDTMVKKK